MTMLPGLQKKQIGTRAQHSYRTYSIINREKDKKWTVKQGVGVAKSLLRGSVPYT